jgi:hypothetical protein
VPDAALPLQRAQLMGALTVGAEIIALDRVAERLDIAAELDAALAAFAEGDGSTAEARLAALDAQLASRADADRQASRTLRARGRILALRDALLEHRAFFEEGATR